MRTTIDTAGRVVIPKALRDEAGLAAGSELEICLRNGTIEIEPVSASLRVVDGPDGRAVIEADGEMPVLTTEDVRDILERVRR